MNKGSNSSGRRQTIEPLHSSLPGTALHGLAALMQSSAPGGSTRTPRINEHLNIGNPLRVAEELKRRVSALRPAALRKIAARICPDLDPPRRMPLAATSLLTGAAMLAARLFWAEPFSAIQPAADGLTTLGTAAISPTAFSTAGFGVAAYGVVAYGQVAYGLVALLYNRRGRARFRRRLMNVIDQVLKPDFQLIRSDRIRAEGIRERFKETGSLDFLQVADVQAGVPLPHGERFVLSIDKVLKARPTPGGLAKQAQGTLLVTTARLLFLGDGAIGEIELERIVRVDVIDEVRLVVTPSKRGAAGIYFIQGHAHELAEVIRLARG